MIKNSQSWAILSISGKTSPDRISSRLKMQPDYFHSPEIFGNKNDFSMIWQIHSSLPGGSSLEEHIWAILKKIAPVKNELSELARTEEVIIYCSVEFAGENYGGVVLSPRLLLLVGSLGINLEFIPWGKGG